ncbi:uncharacterized protein LOC129595417 [Paramacrobiotus metropolitanus]|uniref:uncharacterized protein LOC129595417 n=1 Tax=Paramacrobiotus metropolitanus TaxID=2943436 RepID=UPI002445709F|nr:uncharacterized protein LOC129595417 [Paramacrobiotus metropolitanus]
MIRDFIQLIKATNIWRYGVVAVIDDSGRIRHGMIVDLVADGGDFIVDFDYPDHHAERVPLASCVALQKRYPLPVGQPVRVLLQRQPDQPWCWYSAQLLALIKDGYLAFQRESALVGVYADGDTFRDVVPCGTICGAEPWCPLTKKSRSDTITYCDAYSRKNCIFRQHQVKLPNESVLFKLTEKEGFREEWNSLTTSVLVHIKLVAETLLIRYISTEKKAFGEEHCKNLVLRISRTLNSPERKKLAGESSHENRKRCRLDCDEALLPSPKVDAAVIDGNDVPWRVLPMILVLESLSCLAVDQQMKYRQVSRDWNTVFATVTTASLHLYLEVDLSSIPVKRRRLAFTLSQTITSSTKTLIVTTAAENRRQAQFACEVVDCVAQVIAAMQIKIPLIILWHVAADFRDLIPYTPGFTDTALLPSKNRQYRERRWAWAGVCDRLMLREVLTLVPFDCAGETVLAGLKKFYAVEKHCWLYDHLAPGVCIGAAQWDAEYSKHVLRVAKSIMNTNTTAT